MSNRATDLDWIDMPDPEQQDVERLLTRIEQLEARLQKLEKRAPTARRTSTTA